MKLNGCYRTIVNSKAFTILILTVFAFVMFDTTAVRIQIANALN